MAQESVIENIKNMSREEPWCGTNIDELLPNITVNEPNTSSRKRSWVWEYYNVPDNQIGKRRAFCKFCNKGYAADTKQNGTGMLGHHLIHVCRSEDNMLRAIAKEAQLVKGQTTLNFTPLKSGETPTSLTQPFNIVRAKRALARMIIIDELPFRHVEGEGFRAFMHEICPRWKKIPCRGTITVECLDVYVEEKKILKKALKGQRVCLTTDTWTSVQNLNYMCLTGHFIDADWNMHKRILNFCIVDDHKGSTLGKEVETCLLGWGLDKILTLTVDNASSNNLLIDFLKKKMKCRKCTLLNHELLHVRCCAHILNLVVCDGLKDMNECIIKVRNAVKYVRSSPQRSKVFKLCAEKEKLSCKHNLVLDVPTRWNYTYEMLERAEQYQKAFERLEDEDPNFLRSQAFEDDIGDERRRIIFGVPTSDDWEKVRLFAKFLKLFYDATIRFSGSNYITVNCFLIELLTIQDAIDIECRGRNDSLKRLAQNMMSKFQKYWGDIDNMNPLLFVALVLDPRYKLKMIEFSFDVMTGITKKVKDTLIHLYNAYIEENGVSNAQGSTSQVLGNNELPPTDTMTSRLTNFHKHLKESQTMENKSEVEKYLMECLEEDHPTFDLLAWWKVNASRYHVLSLIARDVLAIPVSTVASESTFSTAGRVIDPFRSTLLPTTVEALICTQNWIRSSSTPISLRAAMDDVETYEKIENEYREKVRISNKGEE